MNQDNKCVCGAPLRISSMQWICTRTNQDEWKCPLPKKEEEANASDSKDVYSVPEENQVNIPPTVDKQES